MAWDITKPAYNSALNSQEIRDNFAAIYTSINAEHDFTTGAHKALVLPENGLTVGTTLNFTGTRLLLGTAVDDGVNKLQVNGSINATQYRLSALNTAPSSATAAGTVGEIIVTTDYIYVCTATNTWKRTALATW